MQRFLREEVLRLSLRAVRGEMCDSPSSQLLMSLCRHLSESAVWLKNCERNCQIRQFFLAGGETALQNEYSYAVVCGWQRKNSAVCQVTIFFQPIEYGWQMTS